MQHSDLKTRCDHADFAEFQLELRVQEQIPAKPLASKIQEFKHVCCEHAFQLGRTGGLLCGFEYKNCRNLLHIFCFLLSVSYFMLRFPGEIGPFVFAFVVDMSCYKTCKTAKCIARPEFVCGDSWKRCNGCGEI